MNTEVFKNYLNVGVALIFIGVIIASVVLLLDKIHHRENITLYTQFVMVFAIIGAIIGAILDRIIAPYILQIKEQFFNINIYTPILTSILFILLLKKIIDGIDI